MFISMILLLLPQNQILPKAYFTFYHAVIFHVLLFEAEDLKKMHNITSKLSNVLALNTFFLPFSAIF